jgi:hypothetical protein
MHDGPPPLTLRADAGAYIGEASGPPGPHHAGTLALHWPADQALHDIALAIVNQELAAVGLDPSGYQLGFFLSEDLAAPLGVFGDGAGIVKPQILIRLHPGRVWEVEKLRLVIRHEVHHALHLARGEDAATSEAAAQAAVPELDHCHCDLCRANLEGR